MCFWVRVAFESVDYVNLSALQCEWVSSSPLKSKENKKASLLASLLEPGHLISFHLIFCSWTGIYTIGSPGSQAFECGLNFTTGFPGSPVCRLQIMCLFSHHNCMSQFLRINHSLSIYIYAFFSFCISLLLSHFSRV